LQRAELPQQATLIMPNFVITDRTPKRFDGDFKIESTTEHPASDAELNYLGTIERVMMALAEDEEREPTGTDQATSALVTARRKRRASAAAELRKEAEKFNIGQLSAAIAADNALVIKGVYVGQRDNLSRSLFVVEEKIENGRASELLIYVAGDLPPPNDVAPPDKQALFVALNSANTVIKTVCLQISERADSFTRKYWPSRADKDRYRAERLLDQYIKKLAGIGRLGLEGPHTSLATLALDELRREFVAEQAGRIKNTYVRRLGFVCAVAALLLFGLYASTVTGRITLPFWNYHKAFLLAAAGAAIGTWLSFSIRRVSLSFDDLAILEEDLLDPSMRVLFVIGLTMTACLLFWTGAMNIEIGSLRTVQLGGTSGTIAFLVGIFSGLSERALATAISGRAAAFVKGIAGG
jgi:hypothetical protein